MSALRAASAVLLAAALAAVVLLVRVLLDGTVALGTVVAVTPLRAVLLVFLTVLGAVVASYAVRNLAGQHRLTRFAALELALVGGLALAVVAATLPTLLVGWVLAGVAVAMLVAHSGTPRARRGSRAVVVRLALGDAALALAVVLVAGWWGTVEVTALGSAAAAAPARQVGVVAGLVLLGGAVRSALVPFHRWPSPTRPTCSRSTPRSSRRAPARRARASPSSRARSRTWPARPRPPRPTSRRRSRRSATTPATRSTPSLRSPRPSRRSTRSSTRSHRRSRSRRPRSTRSLARCRRSPRAAR